MKNGKSVFIIRFHRGTTTETERKQRQKISSEKKKTIKEKTNKNVRNEQRETFREPEMHTGFSSEGCQL
jgi:hypothetical protein